VPRLSVQKSIGRNYSLEDAGSRRNNIFWHLWRLQGAADVQVVEASTFNMMHGSRMAAEHQGPKPNKAGLIQSYLNSVEVVVLKAKTGWALSSSRI